jgi:hypothetical protein
MFDRRDNILRVMSASGDWAAWVQGVGTVGAVSIASGKLDVIDVKIVNKNSAPKRAR